MKPVLIILSEEDVLCFCIACVWDSHEKWRDLDLSFFCRWLYYL